MTEIYAAKIEKNKIFLEYDKLVSQPFPEKSDENAKYLSLIKDFHTRVGDAIIRQIIAKKFDCHPSQIKILKDFYGKPYCKQFKFCHFNISHSGEWVVCVFNNEPVGIDIQKIVHIPRNRMDMIVLRFFHKDEQIQYFNLKDVDKENFFFIQWALKESYIKLLGNGLNIPLQSFYTLLDQNGRGSMPDMGHIRYFQQYDIDNKYKLVACSSNSSFPLSLKKSEALP